MKGHAKSVQDQKHQSLPEGGTHFHETWKFDCHKVERGPGKQAGIKFSKLKRFI